MRGSHRLLIVTAAAIALMASPLAVAWPASASVTPPVPSVNAAPAPTQHLMSVAKRGWYHDPLTKKARAKLVSVPAHAKRGGPTRHTKSYFLAATTHRFAVPATWANRQQVAIDDALVFQGTSAFASDGMRPSAATLAELTRLTAVVPGVVTLANLESARCEGYSNYGDGSSEAAAWGLSAARASAFCEALQDRLPKARLTTIGKGPTDPAVIGGTADARDANNRVVIVLRSVNSTPVQPLAPVLQSVTSTVDEAVLTFTEGTAGVRFSYSVDGGTTVIPLTVSWAAARARSPLRFRT